MARLRRVAPSLLTGLSLALLVATGLPMRAGEWQLPPLTGELSGEITLLAFAHAPTLHWKATLRGDTPDTREGEIAIDGPGTRARFEVKTDSAGNNGSWRLVEARLDVAPWFEILAPVIGGALAGATAAGNVALAGEGAIHERRLEGKLQLEVRDGALRDTTKGWAVEGIALRGTVGPLSKPASDGPFVLTFREARAAGVTAHDGILEFGIDAGLTVHVARAVFSILDGQIAITPVEFQLARPEFQSDVQFTRLELGQIASLLPPVLTDATGRVSGSMSIRWNPEDGLTPGDGRLQIVSGEVASFKMAPQPGFLTSHVSRRLALLPASFGPLSRALSPENPAYETLRAIEMGEIRLDVDSLDVGLRPDGDPQGRTARVLLTARPATGETVDLVSFEINVAGPLADVIRLGLEGRFQIHAP